MKRILLVLITFAAIIAGCSKGNEPAPIAETVQGVKLEFVLNKKLSTGETIEEPFNANVVMIWKATGKDYVYNGTKDGDYAYDGISKTSFKSDYSYLDIKNKTIDLPAGKYFIAIVTDGVKEPRFANSYTTFEVKASDYLTLKKNVSSMANYRYTAW